MGAIGIYVVWAYVIFFGILAYNLAKTVWRALQAYDLHYDANFAAEKGRRLDVLKARKAQVARRWIGVPLGAIGAGLMILHLVFFNWTTFTLISIGWLLTSWLRRLWEYDIAIRINHRLHELNEAPVGSKRYEMTAWQALGTYYHNVLNPPAPRWKPEIKAFVGRLQKLNNIAWAWKWLTKLRIVVPVLTEAVISLFWPVAVTAEPYARASSASDGLDLTPWWRS